MLHATKMDEVIKRNRGTYLDCSRPSEVTSEFIPAHPLGDVWRVTFNLSMGSSCVKWGYYSNEHLFYRLAMFKDIGAAAWLE